MAGRVAAVVERCGVVALGCGGLCTPAIHGTAEGPPLGRDRAVVTGGHRDHGPCVPGRRSLVQPGWHGASSHPGPGTEQILAMGFGGRLHVILPVGDVARIPGGTRRGRGPLGLSGGIVP